MRGWKSAAVIAVAIAIASILARSSVLALSEQSIGGAELASPTSTPTLAPGATPAATITSTPAPASKAGASAEGEEPSDWRQVPNSSPSAELSTAASPEATPSEIPEALDIGSVAPSLQVSDAPLAPLIDASTGNPARGASLRITEAARVSLLANRADDAIRNLARAISIDPSNAYAYLYVGRAYLVKKNYDQALTFLKHAEVGMGADLAWLGEALAYQGLALEESGKPADAALAYQRAIAASPGNLTARVGETRVAENQVQASPTDTPTATPTPAAN